MTQNFLALLVTFLLALARVQGFSLPFRNPTTTRGLSSIGMGNRRVSLQIQQEREEISVPDEQQEESTTAAFAVESKEGEDNDEDDDDAEIEEAAPAEVEVAAQAVEQSTVVSKQEGVFEFEKEVDDEQAAFDEEFMGMAIEMVLSGGGERGPDSAFPNPTAGAVLVTADGRVLGTGRSDYMRGSVQATIENAGLKATPLKEWCIDWVSNPKFRDDLASSTLYVTLEPSPEGKGEILPPITKLIEQTGIPNVVIGCPSPIPELAYAGASALHTAGLSVRVLQPTEPLSQECTSLIPEYTKLANSKIQRVARKQFAMFKRPLGYLHCSVVDSDNLEAFARRGNAFGKKMNGKSYNFRDFGSYEIAPPPEVVWATDPDEDEEMDDALMSLDFEEEDYQGGIDGSPMTPWYEQADAVVATFPRPGNGPADDTSLTARLNGLKWLATHGKQLPAGVERILAMDATDLAFLPLTNDSPYNPPGVDVEAFWAAEGRKPTRVLLRRGKSVEAKAAAEAAAEAAESAAKAAAAAKEAIETGDAALAAEAAIEFQQAALELTKKIQKQLEAAQQLKTQLTDLGVILETIEGGEPLDVMKHLGKRSGSNTIVWRAGCWGGRGVRAILAGAFQYVSAHLAVDATGGRFWQLMVAENAVQAACGPERKVKIFADQEDISLEYCDEPDTDSDCSFTLDGRPIRHVRLDCRVALVEQTRKRTFKHAETKRIDRKYVEEQAPWFL